jgi:ferredoxin-NADP reductase/MOSC domain-containing protein YiiM/ferredoxin
VPVLLAVNVGMPRDVAWEGRTVFTGVWKRAVEGPRMVRRLNIDGDGQGDRAGHGGEQRAVFVYQIQSYEYWQKYLGRDDFEYGEFGENFTVDGLADDEVCIGDRYRIGEAEFEVTQPRVTCYRVGLRLGEPRMPALLVSHHRPGFYLRVLREGHVEAGDEIVKIADGPESLSVAETDALLYLPDRDTEKLRAALRIEALSPGWQGSFRELVDAADGAPSAQPPAAAAAWTGFRELRVREVVRETANVTSIYLVPTDGSPLPLAVAGQYLAVRLTGAGEPAPIRSYSLSSAPGADAYRITVKHETNGVGSGFITTRLRADALVEVAAPRGAFVLAAEAGPVLLISAGIGVTPVLAMLHELATAGGARPVWWIHTARNPAEHALAVEAHELLTSLPEARERLFFTAATPEECRRAHATPGRINAAELAAMGLPADAHAYICGPSAFMADITDFLTTLGFDAARIHTELFGAAPALTPGIAAPAGRPPHQPPGPPGSGPLVTFSRSGISTPFPETTGSVLDLADACDVNTRWSCRTGVCHTCVTPLLSGEVAYDPDPLESPAPGEVLICCARPTTDIVLDM